jgi:hypothetical protein
MSEDKKLAGQIGMGLLKMAKFNDHLQDKIRKLEAENKELQEELERCKEIIAGFAGGDRDYRMP